MTFRSPCLSAGLIFLFTQLAAPQTGAAVHVLASNGMKAVVEELQPKCERSIGHPLSIEYNSTSGLMQKIDAGAPFDVAILTAEGVERASQFEWLKRRGCQEIQGFLLSLPLTAPELEARFMKDGVRQAALQRKKIERSL